MLTVEWLKFMLRLISLFSISVWSPQQACHPPNSSHPCSANTAQWQHLWWCGFRCNAQLQQLYPLQIWNIVDLYCSILNNCIVQYSWNFLFFLVPSYLCPLLTACVLLNTLKEAEWGHITPSCASNKRSLKPRRHSQLIWWASWQALEVATKIFREISCNQT